MALACAMPCPAASPEPVTSPGRLPVFEISPFNADHPDADVISPKSVLFHPSLPKLYINALEAGKTLVYSSDGHTKLATIQHRYSDHAHLREGDSFFGKPVEGWFTHEGRYLWITYYRWSDDPNAVGSSGFCLIDTETDRIVRGFRTGNIPKIITANEDSSLLAVTLWGSNQVELYDIANPLAPLRKGVIAVGPPVEAKPGSNRDATCGLCLRGTAFLPGGHLLAVARMGGGGLSLVDLDTLKVVRTLLNVPHTPRHIQVHEDWLYLSANTSGTIARIALADLQHAAEDPQYEPPVQSRKVGEGARTLKVVGDHVYFALNQSSAIGVTDLDFSHLMQFSAPSYPVGLDVQGDRLAVTSQGRNGIGGHRVWIYDLNSLLATTTAQDSAASGSQMPSRLRLH